MRLLEKASGLNGILCIQTTTIVFMNVYLCVPSTLQERMLLAHPSIFLKRFHYSNNEGHV